MLTFISQAIGSWEDEDHQAHNKGAAPNGGPATQLGNSGVTEGPEKECAIFPHFQLSHFGAASGTFKLAFLRQFHRLV
jgi:hypothetical protein